MFYEGVDFAGEGIDLNDLTSLSHLAANAGFELDSTADQAFNESLLAGGVTRNSLLSQFLVTLPILPWGFGLVSTTFLKVT